MDSRISINATGQAKILGKSGISADTLKIVAMLTMMIDHIGAIIIEQVLMLEGSKAVSDDIYMLLSSIDFALRGLGRLALPIFGYLLVTGFLHTRNVKKYMMRMAIFAVISEIPFDLAIFGKLTWEAQNIFLTLLIGLLVLWGIQTLDRKEIGAWSKVAGKSLVIAIGMTVTYIGHTDYSYKGIVLIVLLYLLRNKRGLQCIITPILFLGMHYVDALLGVYTIEQVSNVLVLQSISALSFVFIYYCNGQRHMKMNKYVFYAFYPVHIAILYVVFLVVRAGL